MTEFSAVSLADQIIELLMILTNVLLATLKNPQSL